MSGLYTNWKSATSERKLSLSVIVCTYDLQNYANLKETLDSLLRQSQKPAEIIVVVDGEQPLADKVSADYSGQTNLMTITTEKGLSITQARNVGIRAASADIIAFTDDDVVVDKDWVASLARTYQETGAISVGGKVLPIWVSGEPEHLPEELYWLVGVTHAGFAEDKITEVRDTFGPNMSFKREVFEIVGYFNEDLDWARYRTSYIQGEESEFCSRMKHKLGSGVIYNPEAIVCHKVPQAKLKLGMLLKRSFYQGYSKALIQKLLASPDYLESERLYLKKLVLEYVPARLKKIFSGVRPSVEMKKLVVLLLCVLAVGAGFVLRKLKG